MERRKLYRAFIAVELPDEVIKEVARVQEERISSLLNRDNFN